MLIISDLFIYPVKSCAAVRMPLLKLGPTGPQSDRHWMIVDRAGKFLTQREYPQLASFIPEYEEGRWILRAPSGAELELSEGSTELPVTVWQSSLRAKSLGPQAHLFLKSELGLDGDIVAMGEKRLLKDKYQSSYAEASFVDSMPLLVVNKASLEELNSRLSSPVPMSRFRANVVVDGAQPYAEDQWQELYLGDMKCRVSKTCARCVMITIDQQTGQRMGAEPLRMLAQYRTQGPRVVFGQYLIHEGPGEIAQGQTVRLV